MAIMKILTIWELLLSTMVKLLGLKLILKKILRVIGRHKPEI